jgi:hypothetical protein
MEVVIALTQSDKSGNEMVARRSTIIEWLLSYPMGKRVDAECRLLNEACSDDARVNKSSPPVTPTETSDKHWEHPCRHEKAFSIYETLVLQK